MWIDFGKYSVAWNKHRFSFWKEVGHNEETGGEKVFTIFELDWYCRTISLLGKHFKHFVVSGAYEIRINLLFYFVLTELGYINPEKINIRKSAQRWIKRNLNEEQKANFKQKVLSLNTDWEIDIPCVVITPEQTNTNETKSN